MLLQSDRTLPPPGVAPDFVALGRRSREAAVPNRWISIPDSTFNVGLDDPENDEGPDRYFGWDNEKPQRLIHVPTFEAQARPLTNEDYATYLYHTCQDALPASWVSEGSNRSAIANQREILGNGDGSYQNGCSPPLTDAYLAGKSVRTVYGPIPLKQALDWPIFASYDELSRCATWMNGRIPSLDEVRSIYNYVDPNKNKKPDSINTKKVSAVNGQVFPRCLNLVVQCLQLNRHLSNDGVEISPPPHHLPNGAFGAKESTDSHMLFADLESCNVGFNHFHPMPVTQNGGQLSGQGNMGGVWEWTSSVLERHEGFSPMSLYPAYTGLVSPVRYMAR